MYDQLKFEKYTEEDFPLFKELVKDDEIMKYISGKGLTAEEAQKKFAFILEINKDPQLGYFKIYDTETRAFLGDCKLVEYRKDTSVFEIGYLLRKQFWRKGIGSRICKAMLTFADTLDPGKDVVGIIDPGNDASRRLLMKFGFKSFFVGEEEGIKTEKLVLKRIKASRGNK